MKKWWDRWQGRLDFELDELAKAGINYERDEEAFRKGSIVLFLSHKFDGKEIRLIVKYPDFYPYSRFEIFAPDLNLDHHQNPFQKNLCMIGRSTENWRTTDTAAAFITERLPVVLKTGLNSKPSEAAGLEEPQGEPISSYYPYADNSIVLIDSSWYINPSVDNGILNVGIARCDHLGLRCGILTVKDRNGNILAEAEPALKKLYNRQIEGKWVRCKEIPTTNNPQEFYNQLIAYDKKLIVSKWNNINKMKIDLIGVLFAEETDWRQKRDGWIFLLKGEIEKELNIKKRKSTHHLPILRFVRAGRAGREDLASRIPGLSALREKKVVVIGLGCLGAPSVLELARCGVGELRILDFDFVEAGTSSRWPFGLEAAGKRKTQAIKQFLETNYPYTEVRTWTHRIGEIDLNDKEKTELKIFEEILDGADLVYDATAEFGVRHLLSDLAAEQPIPYVGISTTYGGWGGILIRLRPGKTEGCWRCFMHCLNDEIINGPNADPDGYFQPAGCADPTFTGTGFDTGIIALSGVRLAVSTLLSGKDSEYPDVEWDVAVINLRDKDGKVITPDYRTYSLKRHSSCVCNQNHQKMLG